MTTDLLTMCPRSSDPFYIVVLTDGRVDKVVPRSEGEQERLYCLKGGCVAIKYWNVLTTFFKGLISRRGKTSTVGLDKMYIVLRIDSVYLLVREFYV